MTASRKPKSTGKISVKQLLLKEAENIFAIPTEPEEKHEEENLVRRLLHVKTPLLRSHDFRYSRAVITQNVGR